MMIWYIAVVMALLAVWSAGADGVPMDETGVLLADLDHDGKPERITRRRLGADEELGTFYQLVVRDSSGQ